MSGNTDEPIKRKLDDALNINKYIDGLSNFVKVCDTPMTLAIQGDWGSGKTSFMNMISEEIDKDVVTVLFNTWQFSQFNLGNQLPLILLATLMRNLEVGGILPDNTKQALKNLGKMLVNVGNNVAVNLTGINVAESIKSGVEADDVIKEVTELKENFQKSVTAALENKRKEKLVVFIDDLDRLPPKRAVEVLEILKLFLDCKKCVFILAIDYDVVCRGISQKYGEGFDEKKGRSFFDKIIQVPFKMPIAQYEIENYIKTSLKNMEFFTEDSQMYVDLITKSIGYNPRAIKRIFNAFLLLKMVYGNEKLDSAYRQLMLFAVLCLQMSYEKVYNYIVFNEDEDITPALMASIAELEDSDKTLQDKFFEKMEEIDENYSEASKNFIIAFCKVVGKNNKITETEYDALVEILNISGTTSSAIPEIYQGNGKTGKGVRYGNNFDECFSYHSIEEKIEKTNSPAGWNGCKLEGYRLFDEICQTTNFANLVADVLSVLQKKNPDKFAEIYNNDEQYGLYGLFHGSMAKGCLVEEKAIPNTEYKIETKNSYDTKVSYLRKILVAMGYSEADLALNVKLAHRV